MNEPTKKDIKVTALHDWHLSRNANMADFGGYEMPLWYGSSKEEHLRVLTHAGMFDTSHMAVIMVEGTQSFDLLQTSVTTDMNTCIGRNKKPLTPGRCVYGAFLNEKGEVIDDTIIFQTTDNQYMVVVNAGKGGPVADHLKANKGARDVRIIDLTDKVGKFDIQGPASAKIMKKILKHPDSVFGWMPYFSFKGHFETSSSQSNTVHLTDGTPIMLSRTGYTGEFGFEIFTAPEHIVKVWKMVLSAGEDFHVIPCGLAARDSLRTGAVLPLSHQDIGHWPFVDHPWTFALPYNDDRTDFTKSFIGDKALLNVGETYHTLPFAGNDLRKVTPPAVVLDENGKEIGTVLSCVTDMAIGRYEGKLFSISSEKPEGCKIRGLSCGFIKVKRGLDYGKSVILKGSRRKIRVQIESDIRPGRTARRRLKDML